MKERCPLTVVQCELHHAGCKVLLPRKLLADHMREESVAHLSLLAAENLRLGKRLLEKEEQITVLTEQNRKLEKTLGQQSLEFAQTSQKQQQMIERLQAQQQHDLHKLGKILGGQSLELTQASERQQRTIDHLQVQQQRDLQRLGKFLGEQSLKLSQVSEKQQQTIDCLQTQQQHDLQDLRMYVEMLNILPVVIKMAGFEELKKGKKPWYSQPFYTDKGGYKMCILVYANGYGDGQDTHVSVFTCLKHGEFDSQKK